MFSGVTERDQWHDELTELIFKTRSQLLFTYSKSTIETLEQGVKYVQT